MAKKKGTKMPATAAKPKLKPVRLDLDPDFHHALRIEAAKANKSMASFARELLAWAIEERSTAVPHSAPR